MSKDSQHLKDTYRPRWRPMLRWGLIVLGVLLAVWQFLTFKALVQRHTAQAQQLSQTVGWFGRPVGTMPQSVQPAVQVQANSMD